MNPLYEIYTTLLHGKADKAGIPLSGTFELTARCNLDCRMCYIHKRESDPAALRAERTAEQWLDLARQAQQAGTLLLLLTGGEPMLRPDFREIYTGCRRLGMMVSVNTNATLIDDDMVRFLAADPPCRVNITLYGASRETYGALCGDPSAYDRVIRAILALKEAGVTVKLNCSVTPYNRQDAPAIYAFAREHGLPIQVATYMFPPVRACEMGCFAADRLSPEEGAEEKLAREVFAFEEDALRERLARKLAGQRVSDPGEECQELPTERIRCRAGATTFWVTWDWKMRPCGMMTDPTALLEGKGFSRAWAEIREARRSIMVPAACTSCEMRNACEQCAALCQSESGSFTGVPDYMCRYTRRYLELAQSWLDKHPE